MQESSVPFHKEMKEESVRVAGLRKKTNELLQEERGKHKQEEEEATLRRETEEAAAKAQMAHMAEAERQAEERRRAAKLAKEEVKRAEKAAFEAKARHADPHTDTDSLRCARASRPN